MDNRKLPPDEDFYVPISTPVPLVRERENHSIVVNGRRRYEEDFIYDPIGKEK